MNKARVESFSDGVFAFAITLLVLGIRVPELTFVTEGALRKALIHCIPQLVPYITSFATIGIIWLNHHSMFHAVQKVEHTTLTLNLLMLLIVSFVPYPTAVLSRYGALPSSAFLYGTTLSMLGISYSLLWMHIVRRQLNALCNDKNETAKKIRRNLLGTLVYPAATAVSLAYPRVSITIYFALAAFYFLPAHQHRATQEEIS
jgi:uncharacterized membrane protein